MSENYDSSVWAEKTIDRIMLNCKIDVYDVWETRNQWEIRNGIPTKMPISESQLICATVRDNWMRETAMKDIVDWLQMQSIWYQLSNYRFVFKSHEDRDKFLLRWQG